MLGLQRSDLSGFMTSQPSMGTAHHRHHRTDDCRKIGHLTTRLDRIPCLTDIPPVKDKPESPSPQVLALRKQAEEIELVNAARMSASLDAMSPGKIQLTRHELRVHRIQLVTDEYRFQEIILLNKSLAIRFRHTGLVTRSRSRHRRRWCGGQRVGIRGRWRSG